MSSTSSAGQDLSGSLGDLAMTRQDSDLNLAGQLRDLRSPSGSGILPPRGGGTVATGSTRHVTQHHQQAEASHTQGSSGKENHRRHQAASGQGASSQAPPRPERRQSELDPHVQYRMELEADEFRVKNPPPTSNSTSTSKSMSKVERRYGSSRKAQIYGHRVETSGW
ncbi:hypothetical protein JCM5350_005306 [Sporobolomyces pararoseus]